MYQIKPPCQQIRTKITNSIHSHPLSSTVPRELENCVKNMDTIDEILTTDASNSHSGVRRCRDTDVTSSSFSKRTKFNFRDHEKNFVQSENHCCNEMGVNSLNGVVSSANFGSCDHVLSSSCFTNCLPLDLKAELRFEDERFIFVNDGFSGVRSPASEICMYSETFSGTKKKRAVTSRRKPPATSAKLPTAAEIDEFFAVAEKKEQKRFSDKYNFDIVNEVPMDGRYQWVRLKP